MERKSVRRRGRRGGAGWSRVEDARAGTLARFGGSVWFSGSGERTPGPALRCIVVRFSVARGGGGGGGATSALLQHTKTRRRGERVSDSIRKGVGEDKGGGGVGGCDAVAEKRHGEDK